MQYLKRRTKILAQGFALNQFAYLTLNTLPLRSGIDENFRADKAHAGLPRPLRQVYADFLLSLKSSALDFEGTYVGPPMEHQPVQRIQRQIQRKREMLGKHSPAYRRKQQISDAWAVQKLKQSTVNTLPGHLLAKYAGVAGRSPDEPPAGMAEHYFTFLLAIEKAVNSKNLEVRRFVEELKENEIVFAPQFLNEGVISKRAIQLAMLEQDAAVQEFVILRDRSPLFAKGPRGGPGNRPPAVLWAEFSRLRCELVSAIARTDLEIEHHLQEDPNVADAKAEFHPGRHQSSLQKEA
ncbi:MAG: hypothetical protein L0387_43180 [Acidobacteria bacterium]|nr:hypothetical protein [Acidobacteriota bacterium]